MSQEGFEITWGGISDFFTCSYNNSNGITPGRVAITVPPQTTKTISLHGRLEIKGDSTDTNIVMDNAIADRGSYTYSAGGEVTSLVILDGRWQWAYQHCHGHYNIKDADGNVITIQDTQGNVPDDDAVANSKRSLLDLMRYLLNVMTDNNKTPYSIADDDILDELFPTVYWDYNNCAYELQLLCNQVNYTICYDPSDNHTYVQPLGEEPFAKSEKKILKHKNAVSFGDSIDPVNPSQLIGILPNYTKLQTDFNLYPMALYKGDFVDLDDLPYAPPEDVWKLGYRWDWILETQTEAVRQEAASSLFKVFRIGPDFLGQWINTDAKSQPKGNDIGDASDYIYAKDGYHYFLPLLSQQLDTFLIDGKKENIDAEIFGSYARENNRGNTIDRDTLLHIEFGPYGGADDELLLYEQHQDFIVNKENFPYRIDLDRGLVFFSNPIYAIIEKNNDISYYGLPTIFLRAAHCLRSKTTNSLHRNTIAKKIDTGNFADLAFARFVPKPDLGLTIKSYRGNEKAITNFSEFEQQCNFYIEELEKEYTPTIPVIVEIASGEVFQNTGIVRSATVSITSNGATATYNLNDDQGSNLTLPYSERLLKEQQKETYKRQTPNTAHGGTRPWSERKNGNPI